MKNKTLPIVSIVGRPNVGKSSLFNRLCGQRRAVIFEKEGTTRDRIEYPFEIRGKKALLVDTGGFPWDTKDAMSRLIEKQIKKAVESSEVLLFVCDGVKGLLPMDMSLAGILRKSGRRIIPVINKIDNEKRKEGILDFYDLGLGDIFGISCLHNTGIKVLLLELAGAIPDGPSEEIDNRRPIKIAIVGRPNVGKSSFLNRVLDEERAVVHEKPGTTRDSIDSYFEKDGILFLLIDTAGIRHKKKVKDPIDACSMMRSMDAIDRADIALFLIDGAEGVTNDDIKIFEYIRAKGKGCVIIVNKWDLVKEIEMSRYRIAVMRRVPEAENFPVAFISARTGRHVLDSFNLVKAIKTNLDLFIERGMLRNFLKEVDPGRACMSRNRKTPKFYYMTQFVVSPKEFIVFVNDPSRVTNAHSAFIENRLRERFPLEGVPVKMRYRSIRRPKKED